MKKVLIAVTVVLASIASSANAWVCYAESPSAWGAWQHPVLSVARDRALHECRIRTPYYQVCYITSCNR